MTHQEITKRLLAVLRALVTDPAITDTIWVRDGCTAVDEIAIIAGCCGATFEEIEAALSGEGRERWND